MSNWRTNRSVLAPKLVRTAKGTVEDRVLGLRSGADDYLVKPFAFAELLARVQALARRVHGVRGSTIRVGPLEVNATEKVVRIISDQAGPDQVRPDRAGPDQGRTVDLAPREFAVLEYLAHRAGKPVTRAELEEHLYDDRSRVMSNTIDVTVSSIRSKLGAAGCPALIHTRRKIGYVLAEVEP